MTGNIYFRTVGIDYRLLCCWVSSEYQSRKYYPHIAQAAEKLRVAEGKRFSVISGDILDPDLQARISADEYDVVLALNIFHRFIKTRAGHEGLIRLLRGLRARTMFFEPHHPDGTRTAGAYANYPEQEFVAFVMQHGGFERFEPIYLASDGRTVFKLWR